MSDSQAADLLARLSEDVATGDLIGHGSEFINEANRLAEGSLAHGEFYVPPDPFKGEASDADHDPRLYYRMLWRVFDKTPASMIQGFAIPVRRILARKLFRHCGDDVIFHHDVLFSDGSNISLGNGVLVNRRAMLDDRGPIEVGDYTMLAAGITIETHTHPFDNFSKPIAYAGRGFSTVTIGANCVLGYNAVVMAGVTLGYRSIVGANSVVTKDVDDYTIVGGVPARPIKTLAPENGVDPVRNGLES